MTTHIASCLFMLGLIAGSSEVRAQTVPPSQDPDVAVVEDVTVTGIRVQARAETFVSEIGAPPEGRKLAVWSDVVCVGSVGMAAEVATVMVDRVLDWAHSLGLRTGSAECDPNILIVSTDDGDRTARELVRTRPSDFDLGASSSDRGPGALRQFQDSGLPVRWWHLSLPVNPDTGDPTVRVRGQAPFSFPPGGITRPSDLGIFGQTVMGSRLYNNSIDIMRSVVIVIDVTALDDVSFSQLSDYVAMIALAQIDPEAVPSVPSILTLFTPDAVKEQTLSPWDRAFLDALYSTDRRSIQPDADTGLIARAIAGTLSSELATDSPPKQD